MNLQEILNRENTNTFLNGFQFGTTSSLPPKQANESLDERVKNEAKKTITQKAGRSDQRDSHPLNGSFPIFSKRTAPNPRTVKPLSNKNSLKRTHDEPDASKDLTRYRQISSTTSPKNSRFSPSKSPAVAKKIEPLMTQMSFDNEQNRMRNPRSMKREQYWKEHSKNINLLSTSKNPDVQSITSEQLMKEKMSINRLLNPTTP